MDGLGVSPYTNPYISDTSKLPSAESLTTSKDFLNYTPPQSTSLLSKVTGVLGAVNPAVSAVTGIIDIVSGIFGQSDYNKQMDENRKMAEKVYTQQRQDEQAKFAFTQKEYEAGREDVAYQKQKGEEATTYAHGRDRKADEWAVKQDNFNKHLQFSSNFNNYLNSSQIDRQAYIKDWAQV